MKPVIDGQTALGQHLNLPTKTPKPGEDPDQDWTTCSTCNRVLWKKDAKEDGTCGDHTAK